MNGRGGGANSDVDTVMSVTEGGFDAFLSYPCVVYADGTHRSGIFSDGANSRGISGDGAIDGGICRGISSVRDWIGCGRQQACLN